MPVRFRTAVQLAPSELNVDFNQAILSRLRKDLEGVCTRFGYIRPNSIEVIKRSVGHFVKQHFNGHIRFEMVCKAEVCNPPQGLVVKAIVKVKNEMGVLAESSIEMDGKVVPVLDIIVPLRAAGISSEINLDTVRIGEEIYVSVLSKRYQLKDQKISVIGKAVKKPTNSSISKDNQEVDLEENIDKISEASFDEEDIEEEGDDGGVDGASEEEFAVAPKRSSGGGNTTNVKSVFVQDEDEVDDDHVEEEDVELYEEDEDFFDQADEDFEDFGEDD